ncbi:Alpha/Beta hydrolase protein [Bombardia bombarda]|uniref:carboxypeptidase C n=1 Tax=Bombardia bombarda TaxID=252184 RepID=A0AA39XMW4_9PEZI|nr:Alpha/Beta hydrolase protein [Bombardia bombarda]
MRFPISVLTAIGLSRIGAAVPHHVLSDSAQQPLASPIEQSGDQGAHLFSLRKHAEDADICVAGSKQYTGTISVSEEKKLFFWFFESRRNPSADPVVIWLNGGPGGSSMFGLFREVGPCQTNEYNNGTVFNKHSWTEFSNVLFIDQPAGVGFSTIRNGSTGGPDNILETSADFDRFLAIFFQDVFPEYSTHDLHIAGESFGGKYVPGITHYISQRQQMGADVMPVPIRSIILVDAVIDMLTSGVLGYYDHFCAVGDDGKPLKENGFNETACSALEEATPECERLVASCRDTYDPNICEAASAFCNERLGNWHYWDVYKGGRDPYDDRKKCVKPPLCEAFTGEGSYSSYLNRTDVKEALGFRKDFEFTGINEDINTRWEKSKDMHVPSTREVSFILDKTPTRLLVINGNNDPIVNTEGQKRAYDHLPWRRQAAFRLHQFKDWTWPDEEGKLTVGGQFKTANDSTVANKLSFFTVDEAGHASPGDQMEAITWLMKCWTDKAGSDARCPV